MTSSGGSNAFLRAKSAIPRPRYPAGSSVSRGNNPAPKLFDLVSIARQGDVAKPPRAFQDYEVKIDRSNKPAGVEIIEMLSSTQKEDPAMPTYERFEDLPVWQEAARLYEAVDALLAERPPGISRSFADQLERAALSVSNNIAEGFERGTTNELLSFLYIARGSAGETRSMLCLLERKPALRHLKSQIADLKSAAESCSRQLRAWAESLQNSDIPGTRYLNDEVRRREQDKKSARAAQARLLNTLPPDHPLRRRPEA